MKRAAVTAVLGLLVPASTFAAAPPWSAPENVSSPATFISAPDIEFDGRGNGYANWVAEQGIGSDATSVRRIAVRASSAAEFGPERSAPKLVTPLVRDGNTNHLLGLEARRGRRGRISLRARRARADGSFSRPDTISTYRAGAVSPSLAVHGVAVAAWTAPGARDRSIVRAAIRRPGRRFGRPFTVRARGRARDVVAGAGPDVVFVAWERAGVIEARVRRAGQGWGRVHRVGPARKGGNTFRVVFAGHRGYLAWLSQGLDFAAVYAAVLPRAGTRFSPVQTVAPNFGGSPDSAPAPSLVAISDRDALLAWSTWNGSIWRVRGAVTGLGGRFGVPFDVSPPGEQSYLGELAAVPAGTVIAVWSRLDAVGEVGDRVRAAVRPPGGSFGPPEDVSDLDRAQAPAVALDPLGLRWIAVWSQRLGPDQGVPPAQITTYLRSAMRPG